MTLQEILTQHPVPWQHAQMGTPGNLVVVDARNQQVQLFTVLEYVTHTTAQIAGQARAQPAQTAPQTAQAETTA